MCVKMVLTLILAELLDSTQYICQQNFQKDKRVVEIAC